MNVRCRKNMHWSFALTPPVVHRRRVNPRSPIRKANQRNEPSRTKSGYTDSRHSQGNTAAVAALLHRAPRQVSTFQTLYFHNTTTSRSPQQHVERCRLYAPHPARQDCEGHGGEVQLPYASYFRITTFGRPRPPFIGRWGESSSRRRTGLPSGWLKWRRRSGS